MTTDNPDLFDDEEIDDDTLVSQQGIAEYFGVPKQTVNNWIKRAAYNGFPKPEPQLYLVGHVRGRRPSVVYQLTQVIAWRATYQPRHGAATHKNASRRPIPS